MEDERTDRRAGARSDERTGERSGAGESEHPGFRRVISWSRFFIVVDVVGLFAAFVALMISSVWNTFHVIYIAALHPVQNGVEQTITQKELVGKLVQQADTALLATVLYVIALGLYSLFVDDSIPMPGWLRIRTLADLKELLASVVIVVVAVVFLGFALTWDGHSSLIVLGVSCGVVIAALALFLWVSGQERDRQEQIELQRRERR